MRPRMVETGRNIGADGIPEKPLDPAQVVALVEKAARARGTSRVT